MAALPLFLTIARLGRGIVLQTIQLQQIMPYTYSNTNITNNLYHNLHVGLLNNKLPIGLAHHVHTAARSESNCSRRLHI